MIYFCSNNQPQLLHNPTLICRVLVTSTGLRLRSHNKFYYMKKESLRLVEQLKWPHTKHKKKKEFTVDPNRLQIDEYMLGQIKKSKHSIKKLKQEVVDLKKEVKKLNDYRDDYRIFQKSKTQDRSASSRSQVHLAKLQRKVFVPTSHQKTKYKTKSNVKSKDSSIMSKSSSLSSSKTIRSEMSKDKKQSKLSKERLAKKIEELKAKARIESTEKRIIKLQVEKKIEKIVQEQVKPIQKSASPPKKQTTPPPPQNGQGYQQLLQLLKTNKTIQSPSLRLSPESIQINHFQTDKQEKEYYQLKPEKHQKIESEKTLQSTFNIQMKSSSATTNYFEENRRPIYTQQKIGSETNLLQSSPSIDTPRTHKRSLKLSRCVDVRIINENNNSSQQGSGFEGLFGANHFRSNTLQMSFEGRDNPKRRLRELEFEFDQLVRQQLISSDPREKELLSLTIRTVLSSIAELKDKISREGR